MKTRQLKNGDVTSLNTENKMLYSQSVKNLKAFLNQPVETLEDISNFLNVSTMFHKIYQCFKLFSYLLIARLFTYRQLYKAC